MRFHTALFDLDGTLLDHFAAIHRCHAYTLRKLGLPEPTLEQVRAAVGAGLEVALARLAGPDRVAEALPIYSAHWDSTMLEDVEAMPGARELLVALRAAGITCAVLTNKRGPSSREVCAHLGFSPYLAAIVGARDTPWLKPDPQLVRHILAQIGASAATACLVGDSPYDWETARNAGLAFLGVTTGTHTAGQLRAAGATELYPSLAEVQRALASG